MNNLVEMMQSLLNANGLSDHKPTSEAVELLEDMLSSCREEAVDNALRGW